MLNGELDLFSRQMILKVLKNNSVVFKKLPNFKPVKFNEIELQND